MKRLLRTLDGACAVVLAVLVVAVPLAQATALSEPTFAGEAALAIGGWLFAFLVAVGRAARVACADPAAAASKRRERLPAVAVLLAFGTWVAARGAVDTGGTHGRYAGIVLSFVIFVIALAHWLRAGAWRWTWLGALLGTALAVQVVVGLAQTALSPQASLRPLGTLGNPNYLGEALVMLIPLVGFGVGPRAEAAGRLVLAARAGRPLLCAGAIALLFATGCRSAWLAMFAAALGAVAILWRRHAPRDDGYIGSVAGAPWPVVGVVLGGLFAWQVVVRRLGESSWVGLLGDARLPNWRAALAMAADAPLAGGGLGSFKIGVVDHLAVLFPAGLSHQASVARFEQVHNEYLQALVELGGVGLGLSLVAFVLWARGVGRASAVSDRARGILCAGIAFAVVAVFGFPLHVPGVALLVAVTLAAGLATAAESVDPPGANVAGPAWRSAALAAPALVVALAGWSLAGDLLPEARAVAARTRAEAAEAQGDFATAERSFARAATTARFPAPLWFQRMRMLAKLRRFDEALRVYDAGAGRGLGMDAVLLRAHLLRALGRHDEAQAAYARVVSFYHFRAWHHAEAARYLGPPEVAAFRTSETPAEFGRP